MRRAYFGLGLSFLCACSAFDPDDGTRSLTITTVSSWTGQALGAVSVQVCLDDGNVHAADWGTDCAVASGQTDVQGSLRLEGLEPEVYQLYLKGPEPWGAHAQTASLVANNGAVSVEIDPESAAAIQVVGDYELGLPQVHLVIGPADACDSNQLVVDLPSFQSGETEGTDAATCIEIENNDFLGTAAFQESSRTPPLDECGGSWCADWTTISSPPRRRGSINGVLAFEDNEVQYEGDWLE